MQVGRDPARLELAAADRAVRAADWCVALTLPDQRLDGRFLAERDPERAASLLDSPDDRTGEDLGQNSRHRPPRK
ncbi:MAG: hypothetical protein ACR2H3_06255 [Acidimicrobiales bacterium]